MSRSSVLEFCIVTIHVVYLRRCRSLPNWQSLKEESAQHPMSEEDMRSMNLKESSILTSNLSSSESLIPHSEMITDVSQLRTLGNLCESLVSCFVLFSFYLCFSVDIYWCDRCFIERWWLCLLNHEPIPRIQFDSKSFDTWHVTSSHIYWWTPLFITKTKINNDKWWWWLATKRCFQLLAIAENHFGFVH